MPTAFSHIATGFVASRLAGGEARSRKIAITCGALTAFPDVDALFRHWIPYDHPLGHRGLTHSLFFAVVAGLASAFVVKRLVPTLESSMVKLWLLFALTVASHGFFDAMTDGGLGIAFFAPFTNARYFFPWRPIPVAPFSISRLFEPRGLRLLFWEAGMFWSFALAAGIWHPKVTWRTVGAVVFCLIGTAAWVTALA